MSSLTKKEKFKKRKERILKDINKPYLTLKEIGEKYGVTKQRVRQICLEFGINRQLETREASSMTFHKIMIDFKLGASIAEITTKFNISREELFCLHRKHAQSEQPLGTQYRNKRNKAIVELFKNGETAKTITNKNIKVLDDPTKILKLNTIYLITGKYGVKRYPKVGNRAAGGFFETKKITNIIVKSYDRKKNPLSFREITEKLNNDGYKTIGGKTFSITNVIDKYHKAKL